MHTVLLADDSALMRRELRKMLEADPELRVVGAARNGQEAIELVKKFEPDVVVLDINMPVMDGLTALQHIMMESPRPVVMVSSLTQEGALTTFEALELGAVDYVGKLSGTISRDIVKQANEIRSKVKAAVGANQKRLRRRRLGLEDKPRPARAAPRPARAVGSDSGKVVVIGISTGGPNTLPEVIPLLPADLGAPILIAQHMPANFTPSFAERLGKLGPIPFKEARSGDLILPNHGYLAPGGLHMSVHEKTLGEKGHILRITTYPEDATFWPSVDVLMTSALKCFGANTIGVEMTGMGDDGAASMLKIRQAGGRTIAESEETAIVFGMPRMAIELGGAEFILPSHEIADKIVELVRA